MAGKGKGAVQVPDARTLEPVAHTVRWERELWDEMQQEIARILADEHRDTSTAAFIRDVMRSHLARVREALVAAASAA